MGEFKRVLDVQVRVRDESTQSPRSIRHKMNTSPSDSLSAAAGRPTVPGLIVQKYGGSSVADAAGIRRAAERISKARQAGYEVVVVVSAMGDTTDELCDLAAEVSARPRPEDLDGLLSTGELVSSALLAIALADLGEAPCTFTGSKAGLITDDIYGKAHIIDVKPFRVRACLNGGGIPIVAGFQGRTEKGRRVTTLGRGGSDLTAVALAAALSAGICEIYTDVKGVYTADPRVVPTARKIAVLSSEEMLEFAACGSKVLHLRCVEYARRFGIPIHVRSSFVPDIGTLILPGLDRNPFRKPVREQPVVSDVVSVNTAAQITVVGIPDEPDKVGDVFIRLSRSEIDAQIIRHSTQEPSSRRSDVAFTVPASQSRSALAVLHAAQATIGFQEIRHNDHVGKVSLEGLGMRSSPEVFSRFFKALSGAGIDLDLVEISETRVGAVTRAEQLEKAAQAVRLAFGLVSAGGGPTRGRLSRSTGMPWQEQHPQWSTAGSTRQVPSGSVSGEESSRWR